MSTLQTLIEDPVSIRLHEDWRKPTFASKFAAIIFTFLAIHTNLSPEESTDNERRPGESRSQITSGEVPAPSMRVHGSENISRQRHSDHGQVRSSMLDVHEPLWIQPA